MRHIGFYFVLLFASMSLSAPLKLALNWKPEPQFGGFYQAELDQEFKKAGLQVEILEGGSGTPTIQMLTFGQVDIAIVSAEEILISNERNPQNPVIALFAVYHTNPQILMTAKSRGLRDFESLMKTPGTIAAQTGLTYVQFLKKKYPNAKVQWVPYTGGVSPLLKKSDFAQQGFLASEPLLAQKQGLQMTTFLIANEGFNPYTTVVAVRKKDFESRKKDYVTLIRTIRKGWQRYLENPTKANKYMGQKNRALDARTFQESAEAQKMLIYTPSPEALGTMVEERWQELIESLVALKVLKKAAPASSAFINVD
ncbi:MAG: ABC transporter substrate-binding protein [Bdellovibrionales bacterium]